MKIFLHVHIRLEKSFYIYSKLPICGSYITVVFNLFEAAIPYKIINIFNNIFVMLTLKSYYKLLQLLLH